MTAQAAKKPAETAPADALILRHDADGVATLTLNRPLSYNALSTALMTALQNEIDAIAADRQVRIVVITGADGRFCAGHDLQEIRSGGGRPFFQQVFAQCSRLMLSLTRLPQPVIARVSGVATAAGCQLVATCDLAVAAESARFGTPGVNIGLFCSTPMVALSRNVGRKQAMHLLLSGELIDAETAVSIGLINRAVPEGALDRSVAELAAGIADKSAMTLKIGKEAFYRQAEMDLEAAYAYASEVMVENMLARDAEEGIDAFIEKRPPRWQDR